MKKTAVATILSVFAAVALVLGLSAFAEGQGDKGPATATATATLDAGPSSAAAAVAAPTTPATSSPATVPASIPPVVTPDPVTHPADALSLTRVAYKAGPLIAVVFVLVMLAMAVQKYAKPGTWLGTRFGSGRGAMVLAAVVSTLTAISAGLMKQVPWGAVLFAVIAAWSTVINPHPTAPPPNLKAV
jgi:hypothetical protein